MKPWDDCSEHTANNIVFAEFVDVNGAVETVVTKFFLFSASGEAMVADDVGFCSKWDSDRLRRRSGELKL